MSSNEQKNEAPALPYEAVDADLPKIFHEPADVGPVGQAGEQIATATARRNYQLEARYEVCSAARDLGLSLTPEQIRLCVLIVVSIDQDRDAEAKLGARSK